ncbi:hypothetical protein [Agilicoccus flavus]|uniref:hypothetical protein n=1 Tax=Agilicoccus flavus TaxID=2775968 RepID=UPI001CF6FD06|nr:hypothetical protein [Agilicoccus flavus]
MDESATRGEPTPLRRFRRELGPLWPALRPLCLDLDQVDVQSLLEDYQVARRRSVAGADGTGDLEALLLGWAHYGPGERAVLAGAVRYLATDRPEASPPTDTAAPLASDGAGRDGGPDAIVGAAVRALLRR